MGITVGSKREVDGRNIVAILAALSVTDRQALARFYCDVESADAIEMDLQLPPGRLAILKREVKQRFFEMRRESETKPSADTLDGAASDQEMDWFADDMVDAVNEMAHKARAMEPGETQNPAV